MDQHNEHQCRPYSQKIFSPCSYDDHDNADNTNMETSGIALSSHFIYHEEND
jgi:hypothetical protein